MTMSHEYDILSRLNGNDTTRMILLMSVYILKLLLSSARVAIYSAASDNAARSEARVSKLVNIIMTACSIIYNPFIGSSDSETYLC